MDSASAYIPMDWRQAITRNEMLPERAEGAALFADISGFTLLTEALALELGPKRGVEELTVHLNRVYDALIAELHRYGGSVIGFAGDAITCWLDGDDGRQAVACGLAMQEAMQAFAEVKTHSGRVVYLGMKAASATGSVRRFLVGDPDYATIDAMAGKTLEHMAAAEHQAKRGEMILHGPAAEALGNALVISEWRTDLEAGECFAVVTCSDLHEQIGDFIEDNYADTLDQYVDLLALHFDRSENVAKKRQYLLQAGEAAQARYANAVAIDYFQRLLPILHVNERSEVLFKLGQVHDTVGSYDQADTRFREALKLSTQQGDHRLQVQCQIEIGELLRKQSIYDEAGTWFDQARTMAVQAGDEPGLAKALVCAGSLALYQGHFQDAHTNYRQSLALRRKLDDQTNVANVLNNMAIAAANEGNLDRAQALFTESLDIRRQIGDKWAIANSLNNLGELANYLDAFEQARGYLEEAVSVYRQLGDKWMLGNATLNLANVMRAPGRYEEAQNLYDESLEINRDLGDRWMLAHVLEGISGLLALQNNALPALRLAGSAPNLRETIGTPLSETDQAKLNAVLEPARRALGVEAATAAWEAGRAMSLEESLGEALSLD